MPVSKPIVQYPDSVLLVVKYLRECMPGLLAFSRVPDPRPAEFVRVKRLGGLRNSRITDRPRIDIQCWAQSEEDAERLISRVRAYALAMAGQRGSTTVHRVREVAGPQWMPDVATGQSGALSGQPRYVFTIEFSVRGTELEP